VYLPPDPASRTRYVAGEIAQQDFWFPDIELPVGSGQTRTAKQLPVLTMVCGYSRGLSAMLIPTHYAEDLFAGWWQHLCTLGAVPRVLVRDGEGAIGRWRSGRSELTRDCEALRGTLGSKVSSADLLTRKRRGCGSGRTITGALVPAWPHVPITSGLYAQTGNVAHDGERSATAGVGLRTHRPDRRR
jgi:hypothetical protein